MTSDEINAIVLVDGVGLCVNEGTEFVFPAFTEADRLDQARENLARLSGFASASDAVKNVPKQYRCHGEDRPDADTDPVIAARRLLRDGPMRGRGSWTGDEEDAEWLPRLLHAAQWIILRRRKVTDETALRLAVRALYARDASVAVAVLAELDFGMLDS